MNSKRTKKQQIEDTHSKLIKKIDSSAAQYAEADEKSKRYEEIRNYFISLKDRASHPGVKIDEIDLSQNDRIIDETSEDFLSLKESIKEQGLLQRPILTLGTDLNKPFLCIAGHRRIKAIQKLGNKTVPSELIYSKEKNQIQLARLAENTVRSNLKPIELAESILRLKSALQETTTGISRVLNKNRTYITELLKIAQWPQDVKNMVHENNLTIKSITKIAKRSLEENEIRKQILSLIEKETQESPNMSDGTTQDKKQPVKFNTKNLTKMNTYITEEKLSLDEITTISKFLSAMRIKGWIPENHSIHD